MDARLLCCGAIWSKLTWAELLVPLLLFLFQKRQLLRETKMVLGWDRLFVYDRESSVWTWIEDQRGTEEAMINNCSLILHHWNSSYRIGSALSWQHIERGSNPSGGIKIYNILGVDGVGFWQHRVFGIAEGLIKVWLMHVDWWLPTKAAWCAAKIADHMVSIKELECSLSGLIQNI